MLSDCCTVDSSEKTDISPDVPPLTSLYLYLTGGCNLACRHCYISPEFLKNPSEKDFLPLSYIEHAIEQAKPLGLYSVKLTGGEPLLHPQLREIVNIACQNGLFCPIESNGILVDESMAEYLASYGSKVFISISLDGSKAKTHDTLRGVPGSFAKSVSAIKYLVKNGNHPQVICTVHQGNKPELDDFIAMATGLGCSSIKFNHLQQMGRGQSFQNENGLTIQEVLALQAHIEKKQDEYPGIEICFDIPPAFFPLKHFLKNRQGRCTILNILGILHTGVMSLCGVGSFIKELNFGHLADDRLEDVWNKNPSLNDLRKKIPENFRGICYTCVHRDSCLGKCIANNYYRTRTFDASYVFCEQAYKEGLFPQTRILQEEKEWAKKNMKDRELFI